MTAPETLEGWFVLHDLRRLDWKAWSELPAPSRDKVIAETVSLVADFEATQAGWSLTYSVVGHRADLMFLHLRPEVSQLHDLERSFDRSLLGSYTSRPFSYLSVIELSRHGMPAGGAENVLDTPYVQSRLYPDLPSRHGYISFYPMNKRRAHDDNWFLLSSEDRAELMRAHGRTGRRYAGRVSQIISGSMGLDDWEWAVTLFADEPLVFKQLVAEMRFDEVSARYADFGPFFVGRRLAPSALGGWLGD